MIDISFYKLNVLDVVFLKQMFCDQSYFMGSLNCRNLASAWALAK